MKEVKSMKKFFIAISLVAMLGLVAVPANALHGTNDAVPGTDILTQWFYVSMPGFGQENTLITITEVKGFPTALAAFVQDRNSITQFDFEAALTPFDVLSVSALAIINSMSPLAQAALEVDMDGDGVNDHWVGYIWWINLAVFNNNLISNNYQVWLSGGMAAGFNGVSYEFDPVVDGRQRDLIWGDEAMSANALLIGKRLLGGIAPGADATFFTLMARYFVLDAIGQSLFIIWNEALLSGIPTPGLIHCVFFDEFENGVSSNIPLTRELNIISVRAILPLGLFAGYPWAGWVDITTPDIWGNGWLTDLNLNGIWDGAERQWLGYSWQRAYGPAAEAWEVIHEMHRETNDI
jgi:hypothetical protein